MKRAFLVLIVVAVALTPWGAGVSAAGAARVSPLWTARYDGGHGQDEAKAMAVSSEGDRVFVTGQRTSHAGDANMLTLGYDAATGRLLWASGYDGPASRDDVPAAIAVDAAGSRVFVTGSSTTPHGIPECSTVAYDASSGRRLWAAQFEPHPGEAAATALAVSPDGRTVYVTGWSFRYWQNPDFMTIAYRTATGARLWRARWAGPAEDDVPSAIGATPDGRRVIVTGGSINIDTNLNYATVGYDALSGTQVWADTYAPHHLYSGATALAIANTGRYVFVTGYSTTPGATYDYATLGYRASDGRRVWQNRYDDRVGGIDVPQSVAFDPSSQRVLVTGIARRWSGNPDYLTQAIDGRTGATLWTARLRSPDEGIDDAKSVAVDPGTGAVYVTGRTPNRSFPDVPDFGTVAYDGSTGAGLWLARYGTPSGWDEALALAVSPGSARVFVLGTSTGNGTGHDIVTLAYRA